mmetsp:Transcript_30622/g.33463  ORF Transcript_30622/g.33463 Transcript_30622/m.33463 type:complete len:114 (+) Transcript_30622:119-460(+)|eukprot:gene4353-4666_t
MSEIYDNSPIDDTVTNGNCVACLDDFNEAPMAHGDYVLFLARCVGVLVAISAILTGLVLMISLRASVMYATEFFGVVGIVSILGLSIKVAAGSRKESTHIVSKIMNIYSHSCW